VSAVEVYRVACAVVVRLAQGRLSAPLRVAGVFCGASEREAIVDALDDMKERRRILPVTKLIATRDRAMKIRLDEWSREVFARAKHDSRKRKEGQQ